MKKIGIIITSLLICSILSAGYVTIEEEKIIVGDSNKVIGELPLQKRVEIVGETKDRYIIKYNSHLASINKKSLRFPKGEQPYIRPYAGMTEKIYEVSLELHKTEEYKVIEEDKTRYLIEYPLKESSIEIWLEKNNVSYNELLRSERFELAQKAKGLIKYKGLWMTLKKKEYKFEMYQRLKGLVKYKEKWMTYEQMQTAKGLVKCEGKWYLPEEINKIQKERDKRVVEVVQQINLEIELEKKRRLEEERIRIEQEKIMHEQYIKMYKQYIENKYHINSITAINENNKNDFAYLKNELYSYITKNDFNNIIKIGTKLIDNNTTLAYEILVNYPEASLEKEAVFYINILRDVGILSDIKNIDNEIEQIMIYLKKSNWEPEIYQLFFDIYLDYKSIFKHLASPTSTIYDFIRIISDIKNKIDKNIEKIKILLPSPEDFSL